MAYAIQIYTRARTTRCLGLPAHPYRSKSNTNTAFQVRLPRGKEIIGPSDWNYARQDGIISSSIFKVKTNFGKSFRLNFVETLLILIS